MEILFFLFGEIEVGERGFGQRHFLESGEKDQVCSVVKFRERLGVEAFVDHVLLCRDCRDEMLQLLFVCLTWHTDKAGGGVLVCLVVLVRPDPVYECARAWFATVYVHISRQESAKALEAKKLLEAKEAEVFRLLPVFF